MLPDLSQPAWRGMFTAVINDREQDAAGRWRYGWRGVQGDPVTADLIEGQPAREGTLEGAPAFALNNAEFQVGDEVWIRFRCMVGGNPVFEVVSGSAGGTILAQLTAIDFYDGSGDRDTDDLTALGTGELTTQANTDCQTRSPRYAWREMVPSEGEDDCPKGYAAGSRYGAFLPGCNPLYHARDHVIPPFPEASPVIRPHASASDGSGASAAWTLSSDNLPAACSPAAGQPTNRLFVSSFCYGLAGNLTLTLVEFRVTVHASGSGVTDSEVKLLVGGAPVGSDKANDAAVATTATEYTYSFSPTNWGYAGLVPLEVNTVGSFGVSLQYTNGAGDARDVTVTSVECRLTYTPDGISGHKFAVHRIWKGPGDFYLFDSSPLVELIRRTGATDGDGYVGYVRYRDPNDAAWKDSGADGDVRVILAE